MAHNNSEEKEFEINDPVNSGNERVKEVFERVNSGNERVKEIFERVNTENERVKDELQILYSIIEDNPLIKELGRYFSSPPSPNPILHLRIPFQEPCKP